MTARRAKDLPPGPPLPAAISTWLWLKRPFEFQELCQRRYGDTFTVRLSGLPAMVVVSDPDLVREVFSLDGDSVGRGRFNPLLGAFVGEGSTLMLKGPEHLRHRKLMLAPLQGERLAAHGETMVEVANACLETWPRGRSFPLREQLEGVTLGIILRCIFGLREGAALARIGKLVTDVMRLAAWPPLMYPALQKDLGRFSPWGRYVRKANEARAKLLAIVRERRRDASATANDVLSILAHARDDEGRSFSDEDIRDELITTIVAGHETAATGLAWAFRFVLDDDAIRSRLAADLDVASVGGLTAARLAAIPLLDACVREALRLQPVVPMLGRLLDKPVKIGGYALDRGSGIICSIHLAHRRPAVYPDPLRFDPTRFLGKKLTPYEFFPFGGGVHRCTGMAFSLYEMRIVLGAVLARAMLRLERGQRIKPIRRTVTIVPSGGPRVVLDALSPTARARPERARTTERSILQEQP